MGLKGGNGIKRKLKVSLQGEKKPKRRKGKQNQKALPSEG